MERLRLDGRVSRSLIFPLDGAVRGEALATAIVPAHVLHGSRECKLCSLITTLIPPAIFQGAASLGKEPTGSRPVRAPINPLPFTLAEQGCVCLSSPI